MRRSLIRGIVALAAQSCYAVSVPTDAVEVLAGTTLVLELQDSLNTRYTEKGDRVSFKITSEVLTDGRMTIPRDSTVEGTVVRCARPRRMEGRAELELEFNSITVTGGTALPLAARLTRVGRRNSSGKIAQKGHSDRDFKQDAFEVLQTAGTGAFLGALVACQSGARYGAGAGALLGILGILLERGPDLDVPPGTIFHIQLTEPLKVPVASGGATQVVAASVAPAVETRESPLDTTAIPKVEIPPPQIASVAANPATPPPPVPAPSPAGPSVAGSETGFQFEVDVNLVMIEATVRDDRGAIYIKLKREDFVVSEDGVKQEIRHFSRDELPLAVVLVIDRSSSVAPVLDRLRRAAYGTLSQLKPGDQVALYSFAASPERLQELTTDRQAIADSIATIRAGGGTNINDALFDAALYLGREAPMRRHAIILISDNQPTVKGYTDESQVIRTALEAETVIYSIQVAAEDCSPRGIFAPLSLPGSGPVGRITGETGGEIFDTKKVGSVESAMQAVISRLKLRFTLGYHSTNQRRDGAFRKIDIRLTDKEALAGHFTVYARRGYYAPKRDGANSDNSQ